MAICFSTLRAQNSGVALLASGQQAVSLAFSVVKFNSSRKTLQTTRACFCEHTQRYTKRAALARRLFCPTD